MVNNVEDGRDSTSQVNEAFTFAVGKSWCFVQKYSRTQEVGMD